MAKATDTWVLKFPGNDAGESEGLGDAGIETFKDSPYASVARECGQNSKDSGILNPVMLSFDMLEEQSSTIPSLDKLTESVGLCLAAAKTKKDEKEIEFFSQAKATLGAGAIKVLCISDQNTKGLIGPCVEGKPFHSLLKGAGVSVKDSNTSGGSFGIGKNAVFAVSDLQTVFYSTVYRDDANQDAFLAQGKTKLVSHRNAANEPVRQTGYWGNAAEYLPASNISVVPQWLKRTEVGTSVFALGFRVVKNWPFKIAYSVLENFFPAIHRGEMSFTVDNQKIQIDKLSLDTLFQSPEAEAAADDDGHLDDFVLSRAFLECLTSSEAIENIIEIPGLGKICLRILVRDQLPKRVAIVRNGMLITTDLKHFGEKFQRFTGLHDFVAVVEPLENEGKALMKRLENPRHDELSAERIADAGKRELATKAMKKLAREVKEALKRHAAVSKEDSVNLDELGKIFASGDAAKKTDDPKADENLNTIIVYKPNETKNKQKKPRRGSGAKGGSEQPDETEEGEYGGSGGGGAHHNEGDEGVGEDGHGGSGQGAGTGPEGNETGGDGTSDPREPSKKAIKPGRAIELLEVRNVIPKGADARTRQLYFTPDESGNVAIGALATGLVASVPLQIESAEGATVQNGQVVIEAIKGKRTTVTFKMAEPYDGPIELTAAGADMKTKGPAE